MAYAENTEIAVDRSIGEIVALVKKAGADQVGQMEGPRGITVGFTLNDRQVRFVVQFPPLEDMPQRLGNGQWLTDAQREKRRQQRMRQRARALLLVVKAKLESVESQVETFEEAFLANIVTATGQTVYERISGPLALEYQEGRASDALALPAPQ